MRGALAVKSKVLLDGDLGAEGRRELRQICDCKEDDSQAESRVRRAGTAWAYDERIGLSSVPKKIVAAKIR